MQDSSNLAQSVAGKMYNSATVAGALVSLTKIVCGDNARDLSQLDMSMKDCIVKFGNTFSSGGTQRKKITGKLTLKIHMKIQVP
jgi:hypothetical protein